MTQRHIGTLLDRKAINDINDNFTELYDEYTRAGLDAAEAKEKAIQAVADALYAKETAETTRDELTRIIREQTAGGDIVPEVVQARGTHNTVGERLNSISQDLAQTAQQIEQMGTMSPKGAFSTYQNLVDRYPTGAEGIYIVQEDRNWYFYGGQSLGWISGGVYESTPWEEFMTEQDEEWVI